MSAFSSRRLSAMPPLSRQASMDPTQPLRHHRRSVDRIWPPALEVRLARLSIDEGSSVMTPHMIIPVPPPVGYEGFNGVSLPDIPEEDGSLPSTMESSVELSRRGSLAMASPTILELDAAHQQHYQHGQHSQVYIKYNNNPQSQRHHQRGHSTNNSNTSGDDGTGGSNSHIDNMQRGSHHTYQQPPHMQTARLPSFSAGSMIMDTNEFGEDLFHTDSISPAASFLFERPSYFSIPERRSSVYNIDNSSTLDTGPLSPTLPLASSPYHRHGGPLSAPSSKATSRANSPLPGGRTPLQEKTLPTNLQQPVANRPASPGLLHLLQPLDPQNSKTTVPNSFCLLSLDNEARPRSPVPAMMDMMALMEEEQDRWKSPTLSALASQSSSLTSSPRVRSPTRVDSPSTLMARLRRQRQLQRPRRGQRGTGAGTGGVNLEMLEIPLIEARDEVSLQDIWRMEDEERQDRMLEDDGDAGDENRDPHGNQKDILEAMSSSDMGGAHLRKGEHHAHEEARLIQQALDHVQ
ncbi:hypothetical protein BG000_007866 [Podila horticola]|nr:hypothetical protein BG000_007866 [Podila horticola]